MDCLKRIFRDTCAPTSMIVMPWALYEMKKLKGRTLLPHMAEDRIKVRYIRRRYLLMAALALVDNFVR